MAIILIQPYNPIHMTINYSVTNFSLICTTRIKARHIDHPAEISSYTTIMQIVGLSRMFPIDHPLAILTHACIISNGKARREEKQGYRPLAISLTVIKIYP